MTKLVISFVILFFSVIALSCEQKKPQNSATTTGTSAKESPKNDPKKETPHLNKADSIIIEYPPIGRVRQDLNTPDQIVKLPHKLVEISGLTYDANQKALYAVNDEVAMIYQLDAETLKVTDVMDFGSVGDFEGVEVVDGLIYVVKSNGNIYIYNPQTHDTEMVSTHLKSANNVEGLGVDANGQQLLLALKGNSSIKRKGNKHIRSVYGFDLEKRKLSKKPLFEVRVKDLVNWLNVFAKEEKWKENNVKDIKKRLDDFAPSGIAVHPKTKNYYILSHSGNFLVVLNADFQVSFVYFLDRKVHRQPEGICFDNNGTLWISNEGAGKKASISRFDD